MRKTYKSFFTYLTFDIVSKAIPVILTPILAYYLTTAEFGIVSNYVVLLNIFGPLVALSTYSALTVYYFKNIESIDSLFSNLTYLVILLTAVLFVIILLLHNQIVNYTKLPLIWIVMGLFAASFSSIKELYTSFLRMEMKSLLFGSIQLGEGLVTFILSIILVVIYTAGWQGRVVSLFLGSLITLIFCLVYFQQKQILKFKKININKIKEFFLWGFPLVPHTLSFWIKSGMDRIIITNFLGLSENGIYSVAFTFAGVINLMTQAFGNIYAPYIYQKLNEMDSDDEILREKNANILVRNTYLYGLFILIICVGLFFLLPLVIKLFFKGDYLLSIALLPWIYIMTFFGGLYGMISSVLFHKHKTKQLGMITFSLAVLQAILSFLLVKRFELSGILLAGTIVSMLNFIFVLILVNRQYNFQWNPMKIGISNFKLRDL